MVAIEEIKSSLNSNSNLTQKIKDNFLELILLFHEKFPEIALDNLDNRVKTLKIENLSKYVSGEVSKYDPVTNILSLNEERLGKDVDAKHILMYEILSMITARITIQVLILIISLKHLILVILRF